MPKEEVYNNWLNGIKLAQKECLSKGITSFQDAGSSFEEINYYKKLAENEELDLRLWVMIRHSYEKMKGNLDGFPIKNIGNHFLIGKMGQITCKAIWRISISRPVERSFARQSGYARSCQRTFYFRE